MVLNNKQLFSCKIRTKNDGVKSSKNFKLLKYVVWRRNVGLVVEQIAFQLGYKFLFLKLFLFFFKVYCDICVTHVHQTFSCFGKFYSYHKLLPRGMNELKIDFE